MHYLSIDTYDTVIGYMVAVSILGSVESDTVISIDNIKSRCKFHIRIIIDTACSMMIAELDDTRDSTIFSIFLLFAIYEFVFAFCYHFYKKYFFKSSLTNFLIFCWLSIPLSTLCTQAYALPIAILSTNNCVASPTVIVQLCTT